MASFGVIGETSGVFGLISTGEVIVFTSIGEGDFATSFGLSGVVGDGVFGFISGACSGVFTRGAFKIGDLTIAAFTIGDLIFGGCSAGDFTFGDGSVGDFFADFFSLLVA